MALECSNLLPLSLSKIQKFNQRYECISRWKAHDQLILASAVSSYNGRSIYVTGGNDDSVAIWDLTDSILNPAQVARTTNGKAFESILKANCN